MSVYKLSNEKRILQPFKSTPLSDKYLEEDLENWIEKNPHVLGGDEPLLIIGRQVSSPIGVVDLLALDADGSGIVIELKRAPSQREAVAQGLEYACWLSSLNADDLKAIATEYFAKQGERRGLDEVWTETFGSEFPASRINETQRVFLVIEGTDARVVSLARYLRSLGADINVISYSLYVTEGGEEILDISCEVGREETDREAGASEERLLREWDAQVAHAYEVFKREMLAHQLYLRPRKSGMRFSAQSREGEVFVCFFDDAGSLANVWLRSDSLRARMDFDLAARKMKDRLPPEVHIKHTPTWFIIRFPPSEKHAKAAASAILQEVVPALTGCGYPENSRGRKM